MGPSRKAGHTGHFTKRVKKKKYRVFHASGGGFHKKKGEVPSGEGQMNLRRNLQRKRPPLLLAGTPWFVHTTAFKFEPQEILTREEC